MSVSGWRAVSLLLPAATIIGCASAELKRVDDTVLQEASASQYAGALQRTDAALSEAKADSEEAQKAVAEAELVLAQRQSALRADAARIDANRSLQSKAERLGLDENARSLAANESFLTLARDESKANVKLAEAQLAHAKTQLKLRLAEFELADAKREEAKATALKDTNNPMAGAISLAEFKEQVAAAHRVVANRQSETSRALEKVDKRRKEHDLSLSKLPEGSESARARASAERETTKLSAEVQRLQQKLRRLESENQELQQRLTDTSTSA